MAIGTGAPDRPSYYNDGIITRGLHCTSQSQGRQDKNKWQLLLRETLYNTSNSAINKGELWLSQAHFLL